MRTKGIGNAPNPAYHLRTVGGRFRQWFLRDILDYAERREPGAVARMVSRLPERLRSQLDLGQLRASSPDDTLSLDDAEEILLGIEAALGDGSGRLLEGPGQELATRTLGPGGLGVSGDLVGTLARMQAPLERPFLDAVMTYEVAATPTGFVLTVGIAGRPRSTRILRALTTGVIRVAFRYLREADPDALRLFCDNLGDRVRIEARYKSLPPQAETSESARPPRRPRSVRPSATPLSDEVERIMMRAGLSLRPSSARLAAARVPADVAASAPSAPPSPAPDEAPAVDETPSSLPGELAPDGETKPGASGT